LIYFLWAKPKYFPSNVSKPSIEGCMVDAVKESLTYMEKQSGFPGLTFSYLYQGESIPYLCYTNLYLQNCINQRPFLSQYFTEQLKKIAQEKIYQCYDTYLEELKSRGYQATNAEKSIDISLNPGQIIVKLNAPLVISDLESTQKFSEFKTFVNSPIYELLMIATYIVQQETKYGDSTIDQPMIFYPNIKIEKIRRDDGNVVYIISDKNTKDTIKFATRSLAWPPGYGSDSGLVREQ